MKEVYLIFDYLKEGGFVSVSLVIVFLIITYTAGYRLSLLHKGRKLSMRTLFNNPQVGVGSVQAEFLDELYKLKGKDLRKKVDWLTLGFYQDIHCYAGLLGTAVLLAPLLGLLGTVVGMIETFSSLSDADLFSSSGGIAGGLSQALVTTQFGLVVAIPGIFLSRHLKKVENKTYSDFLQLGELFIYENRKVSL